MRLMMLQQADEALFRMVSGQGRRGWVALARLRTANGLRGDLVKVGDRLRIPVGPG